jgi:hypothetical protein
MWVAREWEVKEHGAGRKKEGRRKKEGEGRRRKERKEKEGEGRRIKEGGEGRKRGYLEHLYGAQDITVIRRSREQRGVGLRVGPPCGSFFAEVLDQCNAGVLWG